MTIGLLRIGIDTTHDHGGSFVDKVPHCAFFFG